MMQQRRTLMTIERATAFSFLTINALKFSTRYPLPPLKTHAHKPHPTTLVPKVSIAVRLNWHKRLNASHHHLEVWGKL